MYTVSGPDGVDTLTGIEQLQFSDALIKPGSPVADFNMDGHSDIVARGPGGVGLWEMNGTQVTTSSTLDASSIWNLMTAVESAAFGTSICPGSANGWRPSLQRQEFRSGEA